MGWSSGPLSLSGSIPAQKMVSKRLPSLAKWTLQNQLTVEVDFVNWFHLLCTKISLVLTAGIALDTGTIRIKTRQLCSSHAAEVNRLYLHR